ncbi:histidine phosphatase family protein [Candidatus Kaiserbacteria bacterium]|nr:histidine phosphatase family protein [Candidatus Kaiserbacteria bacterium]
MKTIYLVRHGESEGNASLMYQLADSVLSERGREQAGFIAERVAKLPVEVVIASPMARTKETASVIGERIQKSVEYSELFVERRIPSALRGKRKDDPEVVPVTASIFTFDPPDFRYADEENFQDLKARASAALTFLEKRPEDHILVVGHGFFTRFLMARVIFGEELTGKECGRVMGTLRTSNTGLTVLHFKDGATEGIEGPENEWQIIVWNDHAHLG